MKVRIPFPIKIMLSPCLIVAVLGCPTVTSAELDTIDVKLDRPGSTLLGQQRLHFVENRGQFDDLVRFAFHGPTTGVFFSDTETSYLFRSTQNGSAEAWSIKLVPVGARKVIPRGREASRTTFSYFRGSRNEWQTAVPSFRRVVYEDLWPGIDLEFEGGISVLKYSLTVRPGVDPETVRFDLRGATGVEIRDTGDLVIRTPLKDIVDGRPVAFQIINGRRVPVEVEFAMANENVRPYSFGFKVGDYDSNHPLVIDPATLVQAGYIGGADREEAKAVAVDGDGCAYIAGSTWSSHTSFPATPGSFDPYFNGPYEDAFVAKVSADGTHLEYCGYIGGSATVRAYGIAVDSTGAAYVTGQTYSDAANGFPVTPGVFDPTCGDCTIQYSDAFATKINPAGTDLVYSGFVGGTHHDYGSDIAVDGSGNAYITGSTRSTNMPRTNFFDTTVNGSDAFVVKINAAGTDFLMGGYVGGTGTESGQSIALDSSNNIYVTGETSSAASSFPVAAPFPYLEYVGLNDLFVVKILADGSDVEWGGYLGGTNRESSYGGIAVDSSGATYVAGTSKSSDYPFVNGPGPYVGGSNEYDAVITKISPDGSTILYSGYIGGTAREWAWGVTADSSGRAYVVGMTTSTESQGFPVIDGPSSVAGGGSDAFVARVAADGSQLEFSGFVGGSESDHAQDVALDSDGNVYVTGFTGSSEASFPVSVGPDVEYNGDTSDAFLAKIGLCDQSLSLSAGTWTLISIPCSIQATVDELLGDDNLGTYGTDWAVIERDAANDEYLRLELTDTIAQWPGSMGTSPGYWIKVLGGAPNITIAGAATNTGSDFEVSLEEDSDPGRWNMIGHPFTFSVDWADVKAVDSTGTEHLLSDPSAATYIDGRYAYTYTGSNYQTLHPDLGSPTLDLFEGFWVRVKGGATTLAIPPTESVGVAKNAMAEHEWTVQLSVSSGIARDPGNYFGRRLASLDGQDELDLPEMQPHAPPFLTLVFPHDDWVGEWWSFTADLREARPGAGGTWNFEVLSDQALEITLSWDLFGATDDILARSVLIDEESGSEYFPEQGGTLTTWMAGTSHRMSWRVNSLPQVNAGPDRDIDIGLPLILSAGFSDEDQEETYIATVDWGDGVTGPAVVDEVNHTLTAQHTFYEAGEKLVSVCVEDDWGGQGCDTVTVVVDANSNWIFGDGFETGNEARWSGRD